MSDNFEDGVNPKDLLKRFDKNGDNQITEEDFVLAVRERGLGEHAEDRAREAFKRLDANQNGKLDLDEALKALAAVREHVKQHRNH